MKTSRVEKHVIKNTNKYFSLLAGFCHDSKNLYNHANYLVREKFIKDGKWLRYTELDRVLKNDTEYPDYRAMPSAQSAQQTLRLLDKNWKSFFAAVKDWKRHKDKYREKPKMPGYLKKDGQYTLVLTNQNCRLKDGIIHFPKSFDGFEIKTKFAEKDNFVSFQQVRLIPHRSRIVAELVYAIEVGETLPDNGRYIGIDIGVNNLAMVCNNFGGEAFAINGRPLKSVNQFYNKKASHFREVCKRMNGKDYSVRIDALTEKRNAKIQDYLHKASRKIIDYCVVNHVCRIIIGQNKEWKQKSGLSRQMNQHFVQIPFAAFIQMIQYKAEEKGIAVIMTEESYTSGTSFIDNEAPVRNNYDRSRRIQRGMFRSDAGILINADLNGAYQILKKAFPIKWDRGCALHPAVVNVA